jgi:hypothetical protein
VARPADVLAAVAKQNAFLAQQRALLDQAAKVQQTFAQARKLADAAGKLPAKAQLDKAAALNKSATRITELIGPERAMQMAAQLRLYAVVTEARNAEPQTHAPPKCGTARARASRGRPVRRRGSRRGAAATRAGPDDGSGDPEPGPSSGHLDRYALAGRPA